MKTLKMTKFSGGLALALALTMTFCLTITATPAQAASKVVVHFIVVPDRGAAGQMPDRLLADLKTWLARTAGGYTHLGRSDGGYIPPGGKLNTSDNHSFIVSAPKDLTREIEAYVAERYAGEKPFILTWPGTSNF